MRKPTACRPRLSAALLLAALAYLPAGAQAAQIQAVGIENQYADVIAQIGGQYVAVTAIETDPNTDPHSFEASASIAARLAAAQLVVENGLGYDDWADRMLAAAPDAQRQVINVQHLRGLADSAPNPHLWYDPATMPAVAAAVAAGLSALQPAHAAFFTASAQSFDASLKPWFAAIAAFKKDFPTTSVAVTEPVADYLLQAAGTNIATPFTLQAAIMNGTDPSPQDVAMQNTLLGGRVKMFVYNQQVTDPLTQSFIARARAAHIPIVGVYETMPAPGYTYQSWMVAEVAALRKAVTSGASTETLLPEPK